MYGSEGNDVYVNVFMERKGDIERESNKINVEESRGYGWEGKISIGVSGEKEEEFGLGVGMGGWGEEGGVGRDV